MIKRKHLFYGFAILGLMSLISVCRSRVEPRIHRFLDHYTQPADFPQLNEKTKVIHSFQFNRDGDAEGWQPISGIDRFKVEEGKLKLQAINNNPHMRVKLELNTELINAVRIRMKHSKWQWPGVEGTAEIFWTSSKKGMFSLKKRAPFMLVPDNKFRTYTILMDAFPNWRGRFSHFRLDPLRKKGEVEIDSISFLNLSLKESLSHQRIEWVPTEAFINNELRRVILAPPPSHVEQEVYIQPKATLDFGYGVMPQAWKREGDGVLFTIKVVDKKGETHHLFSHYIDPKHKKNDRQWFDGKVDLSSFEGEKMKIVLETMGSYLSAGQPPEKGDMRYDYAVWSNPVVYSREEGEKPNIILIILDTLRADALGCYGYWRQTSPNIDKFVENPHTVLFEDAFSTAPWTFPSHKSLFTSRYIDLNSCYEEISLFDRETTLAEVLHKEGYNTIGVTGGGWLSHKLGIAQGFDCYYEANSLFQAKIDKIYEKVADWLDRRRVNSFFLLFHTYETHIPYTRTTFTQGLERGRISPGLAKRFTETEEMRRLIYTATGEEKRYIRALYDGTVLEADRYVQKLLDKLSSLNLLQNTIIIITSDHGEEFWEHHPLGAMHGQSLYQEMLHVPLIIYLPHIKPPQQVIKTPVSLIDLFPTIVDLAGVRDFDKKTIMGVSLLPLIKGKSDYHNYPLFAEVKDKNKWKGLRLQAIIMDGHKYILSLNEKKEVFFKGLKIAIKDEELFDLTSDRGENTNLITKKTELVKRMRVVLQRFIEQKKRLLFAPMEKENIMLDEELKRRLKALGYLK